MMTAFSLGASDLLSGSLSVALTRWEKEMRPLINFTQMFAEGVTEGRLDPKQRYFLQ